MAAPITFRNVPGVSAPDFGAALTAGQRAIEGPNIFDRFGDIAESTVAEQRKLDTDAFTAQLNSFRDVDIGDGEGIVTADMQRQQFLEQELGANSFIDAGVASQAVTDSRAQDFLKAGEGRAVSVEDRAARGFVSQEGRFATKELRDQQDQVLQEEQHAADLAESGLRNQETQIRIDAANQAFDQQTAENIQYGKKAGDVDKLRKQTDANVALQNSKVLDTEDVFNMSPGLLQGDTTNDQFKFFKTTRDRLRDYIRKIPEYAKASKQNVDTKINELMSNAGLTEREKLATADHNRTPTQRKAFKQQQEIDARRVQLDEHTVQYAEKFSNAYTWQKPAIYAEYNEQYRKIPKSERTESQIRQHSLMQEQAMQNYTLELSGFDIATMDISKINSSTIKAFAQKMAKEFRQKHRFPEATGAQIAQLTLASIDNNPALSTKLTHVRADIATAARVAGKIADVAVDTAVYKQEAKIFALKDLAKQEARETAEGPDLLSMSAKIFKSLSESSKDDDSEKITGTEVSEGIGILYQSLKKLHPKKSDGELGTALRRLLNKGAGVSKDSFFGLIDGGKLTLLRHTGKREVVKDASPEEVTDTAARLSAKSGTQAFEDTSIGKELINKINAKKFDIRSEQMNLFRKYGNNAPRDERYLNSLKKELDVLEERVSKGIRGKK